MPAFLLLCLALAEGTVTQLTWLAVGSAIAFSAVTRDGRRITGQARASDFMSSQVHDRLRLVVDNPAPALAETRAREQCECAAHFAAFSGELGELDAGDRSFAVLACFDTREHRIKLLPPFREVATLPNKATVWFHNVGVDPLFVRVEAPTRLRSGLRAGGFGAQVRVTAGQRAPLELEFAAPEVRGFAEFEVWCPERTAFETFQIRRA